MDDSLKALLASPAAWPDRIAAARLWLDEHLRQDPKESRQLVERLLPEAQRAGDLSGVAWLRFSLGWLAIDADDFKQGTEIMESVKSSFEDLSDHEGISRALNALGATNAYLGIYDLALDQLREAIRQADKAGLRDLAGAACLNMAGCLYELEEPREALQAIEHGLREYTIAPYNIASAHNYAGLIYRSLGQLDEAERELRTAIMAAGGALHDSLEAKHALAGVYLDAARLEDAEALIQAGLAACASGGERLLGIQFRLMQARLALLQGRGPDAIPDLEEAIASARSMGARKVEAEGEKALYLAREAREEWRQALEAFLRHARLKDALKSEQASRRILGLHDDRARREARHFENLYRQISTISEIGQRITANLDFEATLETLFSAVNTLMDAPTLLIALVDEERACLDYRLVMVRGKREQPFTCLLDQPTFGCWCAKHRSEVLIGNLEQEYQGYAPLSEELLFDGLAETSLVFVPLLVGSKAVGVFSVQSHRQDAYDKRQVEAIRAIGAYLAIAIENARFFGQIQRLAMSDSLTGLNNRRRLTEAIEEAYGKTKRYGNPAAVIMLDVDHFKTVNDLHGHDVGDEALRAIAKALQGELRDCDIAGRLGGEEFLVLLPETSLEGAAVLAERLRISIEDLRIPVAENASLSLTASFGVSAIHPEDTSHEDVLKRADKALYLAKQSGRNQVCAGSS